MRQKLHNLTYVFIALVTGLAISFAASGLLTASVQAQSTQDCDDNAVIRCGATNLEDLKRKYRENQQGNVQAIFTTFGIANENALNGMVEGRVTGNNEVFVGDRKVATNAFTVGRQNISNERGSSQDMGGGQFWFRHPSVSFADPNGSLRALVKMDGNNYKFAVILACGNPVLATPVQTPPTPPAQPGNLELSKQVRTSGQSQWTNHATLQTGDSLEFRIVIRNTGTTDLSEVMVRDTLPGGLRLDAGSLTGGVSADNLFGSGFSLGTISRGQQREIIFRVSRESSNNTSTTCVASQFRNVAFARAKDITEKRAEASADIVCQPVTPVVTTPPPTQPSPVLVAAVTTPQALAAPVTLPDTGAGEIMGMFTAISISGGLAHRFIWSRRFKF